MGARSLLTFKIVVLITSIEHEYWDKESTQTIITSKSVYMSNIDR